MTRRYLILISLALLVVFALQGCFLIGDLPTPSPVAENAPEDEYPELDDPPLPPPAQPPEPGRFALRYDPSTTLNPLLTLNRDNIILSTLMYESLFALDTSLNAVHELCADYSSEDFLHWTFEILPDIAMSDGTTLTATDVVYSFRQAITRGRFESRFNSVTSLEVIDELSFSVLLNSPNSRFINLLDFPIIKTETMDMRVPPGTGSYIFSDEGGSVRLNRFRRHRDYGDMPVSVIHLVACADNELTELFDSGEISLLWDDPASTYDIRLNRLHEMRFYDTTSLQFIGFNANNIVLRDRDVRRGISSSIERQFIVDEIMPGQSIASPLAISPAFFLYDPEWEARAITPFQEMSILFERARLSDSDNDSLLELYDGLGGYIKFSIDFIVNTENTHKVQAAHRISNTLRLAGINITVRELPWDRFLEALEEGEFDMYYGEIMLGGDFDLSPLLLPGPLDYGETADSGYRLLIEDFLAAKSPDDIQRATQILCEQIKIFAPFAPILYKKHAIYTPLGATIGAEPSQSSIFRNFKDWTINLTMLT